MPVKSGLEILLKSRLDLLRGLRLGVLVHPPSLTSDYRHLIDVFHEHPEIDLRAIFGPQHGVRGETQDNMIEWEDFPDSATGLPVFSLYGRTRRPTAEMLGAIDALVVDLQDVGARYYTFIYTLALAMEACREADKTVIVLDRPNPVNGVDLEGPVLDPEFASFVGLYPLPIRHGMTVGELALFFNRAMGIGCRLEVIPMAGWRRDQFFDQTGLPWVLPSPNLPTLDSALVYPGMCLLEGTNLSEGRGTTRPFELSGAPWVDPRAVVERLNPNAAPGAKLRPAWYIPTFHKWSGRVVAGVQIHVTERRRFRPFRTALQLMIEYRRQGGSDFSWNDPPYEYEFEKLPIDILCGTDAVRLGIESGASAGELESDWLPELDRFERRRREYLLY